MNLKEKRQELRRYAMSIGLCGACRYYDIILGTSWCKKCRTNHNKAVTKQRHNKDNCSRCGQEKNSSLFKTCDKCRVQSKKEYKKKTRLFV